MKVLVIGSGGREHCLVWKLAQSASVDKIYCAPGNGGTDLIAENVDISVMAIDKLLEFALENKIDLTVVGPELPLVNGIVDRFQEKGLKVFGPTKDLALLEGSKVFAKEAMQRFKIPTADFAVFDDSVKAKEYIAQKGIPIVIKADGLAAGKGVIVCNTVNEALGAVDLIMEEKIFGRAGNKIVVEECLEGEEVSLLLFTDGESIVPLVSSQDHKRALDGDQGPNTGGMGAYAPAPMLNDGFLKRINDQVCRPLVDGLNKEGTPYKGLLYVGLMMQDGQPKVLEFNVRFGDPETQAILPKLKSDLADLMLKTIDGKLTNVHLEWDDRYCVCVVLACAGYPGNSQKGGVIEGLDEFKDLEDVYLFHAATKKQIEDGTESIVSNGGRVLNLVGLGQTVHGAQNKVYSAVKNVKFEGMQYRHDIGNKALQLPK
ncbi:MAG: phosphoribosylamine--glycine ligase [Candidatus Omnitrophica bacterium]|nr:phosphoribosylamine--glycine ligase [Candidatus Omnitrophota bacterium]